MANTPLESVPGWSQDQVARMKQVWVNTVEQVVALAATVRGVRSLAEHLNVSEQEARSLVKSARAKLAPAVRAQMEEEVDTSESSLRKLA